MLNFASRRRVSFFVAEGRRSSPLLMPDKVIKYRQFNRDCGSRQIMIGYATCVRTKSAPDCKANPSTPTTLNFIQ